MQNSRKMFWVVFPPYLIIIFIFSFLTYWIIGKTRTAMINHGEKALIWSGKAIKKEIESFPEPLTHSFLQNWSLNYPMPEKTDLCVISPNKRILLDTSRELPKGSSIHHFPEMQADGFQDTMEKNGAVAIKRDDALLVYMEYQTDRQDRGMIRLKHSVVEISMNVYSLRTVLFLTTLFAVLCAFFLSLERAGRISSHLFRIKNAIDTLDEETRESLPPADIKEIAELVRKVNAKGKSLYARLAGIEEEIQKITTVLFCMAEGVLAVDEDGKIIISNPSAHRILGISGKKLEGHPLVEVIRNIEMLRFIENVIATGRPAACDVLLRGEKERILHISGTPMTNDMDCNKGMVAVLNDVTHLRQLENMQRDLVLNVSHEIKTPLTAIKGFVETLLSGAAEDPGQAMRFLKIIEKHVNRLVDTIEDMVTLSRIEQKDVKIGLRMERCDLSDVILSSVSVVRGRAAEKQIRIHFTEADIRARANSRLLEHAVVNLLDNAIKYSEPETDVNVTCFKTEKENIIRIQDHGIGIAGHHLPRLFERFYRVDKSRSRERGGTGLGLAIVKHIIQAHNGYVHVESIPGRGSTFEIRLPGE